MPTLPNQPPVVKSFFGNFLTERTSVRLSHCRSVQRAKLRRRTMPSPIPPARTFCGFSIPIPLPTAHSTVATFSPPPTTTPSLYQSHHTPKPNSCPRGTPDPLPPPSSHSQLGPLGLIVPPRVEPNKDELVLQCPRHRRKGTANTPQCCCRAVTELTG